MINNGQYGGLLINVPRLMNEMIVEAHERGKVVYEDCGDKSLIGLFTKRFKPKKKIFKQSCSDVQQPQQVVKHTKTPIFRQIKTN